MLVVSDLDSWTVIGDAMNVIRSLRSSSLHYFEYSISAAKQLTRQQLSLEPMQQVRIY